MSRVVVFSLGWGCEERIASNQMAALGGADVEWLYDWRQMPSAAAAEALRERVGRYEERYLVAWSFGVWAAEQVLRGVDFTRAVAVNGTPLPADERFGVGARRLSLTLRGLPARGMDEFLSRAYGDSYQPLLPLLNPRGTDENIRELRMLIDESQKPYEPSLRWDAAVVGSGDLIFPPENMAAYWGERAKTLPLPHYPFEDPGFTAHHLGL